MESACRSFSFSVLSVLCVGVSWSAVQVRVREFYATLLVAETAMIGLSRRQIFSLLRFLGAHARSDVLAHRRVGGAGRTYAAVKFLLFTLAGSVLMLVGLIALLHTSGTLDFQALARTS